MCMDNLNQRNYVCDFAKGIAIIMVILVHSRQGIEGLSNVFNILIHERLGSQLFLIISGFLAMYSLDRNKDALGFYLKRIISIAPGLYLIIIITYILNTISYDLFGVNIGFALNRDLISILCNVLFLNGLLPFCNNNVVAGGWYIGILMLLYFVSPALHKLMTQNERLFRMSPFIAELCTWLIAGGLWIIGVKNIFNNSFYQFDIITQAPCYLMGGLYLNKKQHLVIKRKKLLGIVGVILILFSAASEEITHTILLRAFLFSLGASMLLQIILSDDMNFIPGNKVFDVVCNMGRRSYYIYLIHPFLVWTMPLLLAHILRRYGVDYNSNIFYLVLVPFMFLFSWYFSIVFEKVINPISQKLKNSIIRKGIA